MRRRRTWEKKEEKKYTEVTERFQQLESSSQLDGTKVLNTYRSYTKKEGGGGEGVLDKAENYNMRITFSWTYVIAFTCMPGYRSMSFVER